MLNRYGRKQNQAFHRVLLAASKHKRSQGSDSVGLLAKNRVFQQPLGYINYPHGLIDNVARLSLNVSGLEQTFRFLRSKVI
jgi:hypothetical protein